MTVLKIKEEIGQYIEHADERFLQLVYGMMKADQTATIGYSPDGTAITREDLIERAEASERDIISGNIKNLKSLKEEIENW